MTPEDLARAAAAEITKAAPAPLYAVKLEGGHRSPQIGALAAALAKAQGEIGIALRDSKVDMQLRDNKGRVRYNYADLASVTSACRGPLAKNGLAVSQPVSRNKDGSSVVVTSILMHASGEWISSELAMGLSSHTPQAVGIAITYCRRYALASLVGVVAADEDDETELAEHATAGPAKTADVARQAPKPHDPVVSKTKSEPTKATKKVAPAPEQAVVPSEQDPADDLASTVAREYAWATACKIWGREKAQAELTERFPGVSLKALKRSQATELMRSLGQLLEDKYTAEVQF